MEVSKMLSVIIISVLVITMVIGEQIVIDDNQHNVIVNEMNHVIGKRSYASNECHASHMQKVYFIFYSQNTKVRQKKLYYTIDVKVLSWSLC